VWPSSPTKIGARFESEASHSAEPVVTNEDISSASGIPDPDASAFDVEISFTAEGAEKMREATTKHMGQPMAILIDGQVVAAPVVKATIGSRALITGKFTKQEAERIANGVTIR
jgi:preprotein translocase subunit SecD